MRNGGIVMVEGGIIIIIKKNRRISRGDFGELSEGICPHLIPSGSTLGQRC
jgi:hypothetical protein